MPRITSSSECKTERLKQSDREIPPERGGGLNRSSTTQQARITYKDYSPRPHLLDHAYNWLIQLHPPDTAPVAIIDPQIQRQIATTGNLRRLTQRDHQQLKLGFAVITALQDTRWPCQPSLKYSPGTHLRVVGNRITMRGIPCQPWAVLIMPLALGRYDNFRVDGNLNTTARHVSTVGNRVLQEERT